MALNGTININVGGNTGYIGGNTVVPSFFGSFDPRSKIPSGDSSNSSSPGGIELTKDVSILYKSSPNSNGFYVSDTSNTVSPSQYINLYVLSAEYGYEIQSSDAYSKFYYRSYPISSVIRKATIQGIARNEYEYEDLAYWIRVCQYQLARGDISYMGLYIPATGINGYGFIPKFSFALGDTNGTNPNPIPIGIVYEFEFIITEDATDSNNTGDIMQVSYSNNVRPVEKQYWISGNVQTGASGVSWQKIQGQYTDALNAANQLANISNLVPPG